jgi:hypothetical protein
MGTFNRFVDFMSSCGYINACHYFLQDFSLKRRGNGFPALVMERASFTFLFCSVLPHKKGAVLK